MVEADFIKKALHQQQMPAFETDIPHIQAILETIKSAETPLKAFPNFNEEVPITIVDKELMR